VTSSANYDPSKKAQPIKTTKSKRSKYACDTCQSTGEDLGDEVFCCVHRCYLVKQEKCNNYTND